MAKNIKEQITSIALRNLVESYGGKCWKVDSDVGVPDRLVVLPGLAMMVEVKKEGKDPRPIQQKHLDDLGHLGMPAIALRGQAGLKAFEEAYLIRSGLTRREKGGRLLEYPE